MAENKEKEMESTPVFLPGESHGQRSMAGYGPWSHKESDTTAQHNQLRPIYSPVGCQIKSGCLVKFEFQIGNACHF